MLVSAGFTEAAIFAWSPELLASRYELVMQMRNRRMADEAVLQFLSAATVAGAEGTGDQFDSIIAELYDNDDDSTDAWLLNPNAQTDWDAVRTVATQVKVSPDPPAEAS